MITKIISSNIPGKRTDYKKLKNAMYNLFPNVAKKRDGGGYIYKGLKLKSCTSSTPVLSDQRRLQSQRLTATVDCLPPVRIQPPPHSIPPPIDLNKVISDLGKENENLKTKAKSLETLNSQLLETNKELSETVKKHEEILESLKRRNGTLEKEKQNLAERMRKSLKDLNNLQRQQGNRGTRVLANESFGEVNFVAKSDLEEYRDQS